MAHPHHTHPPAHRDADALTSAIDLTGAAAALAAGLPDPATLTQLANQFFGALPSQATGISTLPPSTPTLPPGIPTLPTGALIPAHAPTSPQSASALAGGALPSALPGPPAITSTGPSLAALTPASNAAATAAASATSFAHLPGLPSLPSLGFLADIRSLEALAGPAINAAISTAPGSALPAERPSEHTLRTLAAQTPAPPTLPGIQALPALAALPTITSPGPAPSQFSAPVAAPPAAAPPNHSSAPHQPGQPLPFGISRAGLASPQLPSVPASSASLLQDPTPAFLDLARPLDPAGIIPTLAPLGAHAPSHLGGLSAADISSSGFDVQAVRRDFPILHQRVNGRPLIWLDNAATTQKPQSVIDRLAHFYTHENSNVHRAAHTLAARATDAYEAAREKVRAFLNAPSAKEIIFVRGTTEGINLVAQTWGKQNIAAGDEIVISHLEHHANIVPWQMLCAQTGAKLRVAPVDDSGQIILAEYEKLFSPRTRLAAFSHVSNALGTVTPVHQLTEIAHRYGAKVLVDGAQSVSHIPIDVQSIDCDFFVFSGHKVFGPTGIGVVFGKHQILQNTPPYQGGGNMIADVTFEKTIYHPPPLRFEAGTGNIADAVGLGAAIDYLTRLGMPTIARAEHDLLAYATHALGRIPGLRFIGTAKEKTSVLSFVLDGHKTEDVGAGLAQQGIAVRAGHHCAQPILRRFGLESTVRPSLAFYNTCDEIDALVAAIYTIQGGRTVSVV